MAPDLVPKSGTKIGAAFYDVSTTLDCKRGRFSEPDSVPNSGLNSGLVSVRFDTLSPQILYSVLKPFCNVFWIVPHPRFVSPLQPSLLRLALRHTMPHNKYRNLAVAIECEWLRHGVALGAGCPDERRRWMTEMQYSIMRAP